MLFTFIKVIVFIINIYIMSITLEYSLEKTKLINKHTFNPSIIFRLQDGSYQNKINLHDDCNFILSYRSSSTTHSLDSKIYIKTNNIMEYDKLNNKIKLHFSEDNERFGSENEILEDSRFTILKNKLYLLYTHNYNSNIKQILSPYSDENSKIEILKGIKLNNWENNWEKNWVIFNKKNSNSTFIIYQFYPDYIICELDQSILLSKIKSQFFPFSKPIRGGTSPIEIDNKLYLFCHTHYNGYRLSVILLDNETLDIISYCNNILEENTNIEKITFCRGSLYIENLKTFIVSVGINDIDIDFVKLDLDYVNSKLYASFADKRVTIT